MTDHQIAPEDRTGLRAGLRAAATGTAARLAPGHGIPLARHLALLAEAEPPPAPSTWTDADALVVSAFFAARARRDALEEGTALIDRYFENVRLTRPTTLSPGVRSQLYASVGEYCAAIGWPQMGARYGSEAELFADTDALRYRALSVAALGQALNGEYPSAETSLRVAEELFAANGWPLAETAYLLLLAHGLVGSARMDTDRLTETVQRMTLAQPDDAYWSYSTRAIEVMGWMISGDFALAHASSRELLTGSDRQSSHRMMRLFLACALSDILVAQGASEEALALLEPYESSDGHGICFAMQKSAALLSLGRDRELLDSTDSCIAAETYHCLRTLTPLMLRRALALNRLGHAQRASTTMGSALLLIERTGMSATPFIMLPRSETAALIDIAIADHPGSEVAVPFFREALRRLGSADDSFPSNGQTATLTPTERALADQLLSPLSLSDIARERRVSPNTIKSQVRSIYVKLGVSSRAEAVARLTSRA